MAPPYAGSFLRCSMRSRFIIKSKLTADEIRAVLSNLDLIPNIDEDSAIALHQKDSILSSLPDTHGTRELVEQTFRFVIFDYSTSTWGMVNEPTPGIFQFRFIHEEADTLFDISEKHLHRLQGAVGGEIETAPDGQVEVFERSGGTATLTARYSAKPKPSDLFRENKQAAWSAGITLLFGIMLTAYSHPRLFSGFKSNVHESDPVSTIYWEGFSGRMATAFFVGSIMAIYDIAFYFRTASSSPRMFWKKRQ